VLDHLRHFVLAESRTFTRRGFPLLVAVSWLAVWAFSTVPANLWVVKGTAAEVVIATYVAVTAATAVTPGTRALHYVGAPLAVLVYLGRGGGFFDLALDGRPDLWGAVAERVVMAVAMTLWHRGRVAEIGDGEARATYALIDR